MAETDAETDLPPELRRRMVARALSVEICGNSRDSAGSGDALGEYGLSEALTDMNELLLLRRKAEPSPGERRRLARLRERWDSASDRPLSVALSEYRGQLDNHSLRLIARFLFPD